MAQVLNSGERTTAFFKFLLFFLITVALIILAIFFNFRMPIRENAILLKERDMYSAQETNQRKFAAIVLECKQLLDSLDGAKNNFNILTNEIESRLTNLSALMPSIPSNAQMNKTVYEIIFTAESLKKEARSKQQDFKNLEDRLLKCKEASDNLRINNSQ